MAEHFGSVANEAQASVSVCPPIETFSAGGATFTGMEELRLYLTGSRQKIPILWSDYVGHERQRSAERT